MSNIVFDPGTATSYSEDKLETISKDIVSAALSKENKDKINFGVSIKNDWDDDEFISEMYEQYLRTVQRGADVSFASSKLDAKQASAEENLKQVLNVKKSTFEQYLNMALAQLTDRRVELKAERDLGSIDQSIHGNAISLIDVSERAIKKYLERNETSRLIGV